MSHTPQLTTLCSQSKPLPTDVHLKADLEPNVADSLQSVSPLELASCLETIAASLSAEVFLRWEVGLGMPRSTYEWQEETDHLGHTVWRRPGRVSYKETTMGRRCPPDILSEVFLLCLPGFDKQPLQLSELYNAVPSGKQIYTRVDTRRLYPPMIPMILSSVCRDWRECALGTAGLWSNIVLDGGLNFPTFSYDMVREWTVRSKEHPLTLQWRLYDGPNFGHNKTQSGDPLAWMFDIVFEEARRWSHVYIGTAYGRALAPLAKHIGPPFELLESLWLDMQGVTNENLSSISRYVVERAPKLREFGVTYNTRHNREPLDFSHKQITHLKLCKFHVPDILRFLDGHPSLTCAEVEVDSSPIFHHPPPTLNIVKRPQLTSLTINLRLDYHLAYLFDRLSTPDLTKLDFLCPPPSLNHRSVHEFLSRSSCKLQSFRLRALGGDTFGEAAASMLGFLSHASVSTTLEDLDFWNSGSPTPCRFTDELFQFLTLSSSANTLPRLGELRMSGSIDTDSGLSIMADMLESRFTPKVNMDTVGNEGIRALAKVEVDLEVDPERGSHRIGNSKLKALKDAGFPVEYALKWRGEVWSKSGDD